MTKVASKDEATEAWAALSGDFEKEVHAVYQLNEKEADKHGGYAQEPRWIWKTVLPARAKANGMPDDTLLWTSVARMLREAKWEVVSDLKIVVFGKRVDRGVGAIIQKKSVG